jgi:predicted metal-dependent phosphoesterase TrpH
VSGPLRLDRAPSPLPQPFAADGVWLRSALHAHTTNSDGDLPPDKLVAHYERAGYDVLAITDHWVRTDARSTRRLIVIPSAELNAQAGSRYDDAHVLAFGIATDPVPPENEFAGMDETVKWILDAGGIPYLAHPTWSGLRAEQYEKVEGLAGIEIWNTGCELELGRGNASAQWDEVLEKGRLLWGVASDDSHHPGFDSRRAWTWVRAVERSAEAVLAALRNGMFYSSTGPLIHALEVDAERVVVRTSPVATVTLYAGRRSGARVTTGQESWENNASVLEYTDDGLVTACELRVPWPAPYGRVEVADSACGRAWTNPLWN